MGEDGPKVIYRTRIRVRTAVLVVAFLVLLGVYGYTSERYPPEEKASRPVSTEQELTKRTRTPSSTTSTTSTSSTTESSTSETEETATDESTTETPDTSDETLTSRARRPKLTTTSVPGIPVPIPRITTEDGDETTTAEESSAP